MKILTKEEQEAHYRATIRGGIVGGGVGLALGSAGVWFASRRFPAFRQLTVPFRFFLIISSSTVASIITAEKAGERYERIAHPERAFKDRASATLQQIEAQKGLGTRVKDWATEHRYGIVFGSWLASMGIALGIVSRNRYLTGPQKLVQARVYAQGLTVAVLLASFALEGSDAARGKGRWETIKVLDPNDPLHQHMIERKIHHERYEGEDQWMDMVASEERRMKEREQLRKEQAEERRRAESKASRKVKAEA